LRGACIVVTSPDARSRLAPRIELRNRVLQCEPTQLDACLFQLQKESAHGHQDDRPCSSARALQLDRDRRRLRDNAEREVQPPPDDPTIVRLSNGPIQGALVGDSRSFLGSVRQAAGGRPALEGAAETGSWTDLFSATAFGKRCAQVGDPVLQNAPSSDEDCLYLNVWTPSPVPAQALPVMVWIHGGGNCERLRLRAGAIHQCRRVLQRQFLAESHGVVVVSLNYRLGVFGSSPTPRSPPRERWATRACWIS